MLETIGILLLQTILTAYTISRFEPLKMLLDLLPDNLFWNLLRLLLTCSKCLAFWTGILFGGIWIGMGASLLITLLEKTIFGWMDQIRLN